MIETREALEALDDILGVDGVDGVFIGPADLSIALSDGAKWEPRGAARNRGGGRSSPAPAPTANTPACSASTAPTPPQWPALGFKLCSVGSDGALLRAAASGRTGGGARPVRRPGSGKGVENLLNIMSWYEAEANACTGAAQALLACIRGPEPLE